jgi:2-oxoglutarate dehydrogenase dihydrolipoamide succinyltransferase (E2 component)
MKIQMPRLGETIVEGTVLKWLKAEGDTIQQDEPLFEISTDKVDTEVPSPVTGVISKILVAEGQTVPVGTELAEVTVEGEAVAKSAPVAEVAAPVAEVAAPVEEAPVVQESVAEATVAEVAPAPVAAAPPVAAPVDRGLRSQILSPLVRKLAAEHMIDLSSVAGTGMGGRITKSDVLAVVAAGSAAPPVLAEPQPAMPAIPLPTPPEAAVAQAPITEAPAAEAPIAVVAVPPVAVAGLGEEVVPLSHIRKAIGSHMMTSLQGTARAWTMVEVNVEHLVRLRETAKDAFLQRHGVKLTYLPMVTRATAEALLQFPMVNAELRGEELVVRKFVNMGIAVSYDQGLIVPVIKGADGMNVAGLARAIADLAARARAHSLSPDEVNGATFTITNPGPYGSILSVPIINLPNAAILSLDAIQKRAIVIDDAIAIRSMVNVSMSWDHRVVDGELATRFLGRVKQNLETWNFAEDLGL